jgi:YVTN family beta-propeller protein
MINPAPFIKQHKPRNFNRNSIGGDYRYLYVLNRRDQTVSVIDVSTNTVTATITLTAAKTFTAVAYRSVDKTVLAFGTNYIDRIDADPSSGTFNTVLGSHTTTTGAGAGVVYLDEFDGFLYGSSFVNGIDKSNTGLQYNVNYSSVYWRNQNICFLHNISHLISGTIQLVSDKRLVPSIQPFLSPNTVAPVKVKDYYYSGSSSNLTKSRWSTLQYVAGLTVTQASIASMIYDPNNNRLWVGTTVNGSTNLQVITLSNFTVESTESRAGSIDTNESATRDILFCPYNGYIYAKASNTSNPATGLGRVHYYDPSLSASSRYVGYVSVGQDGSGTLYGKDTMCFNGLKIMEH